VDRQTCDIKNKFNIDSIRNKKNKLYALLPHAVLLLSLLVYLLSSACALLLMFRYRLDLKNPSFSNGISYIKFWKRKCTNLKGMDKLYLNIS
jgi:hypothetical protein